MCLLIPVLKEARDDKGTVILTEVENESIKETFDEHHSNPSKLQQFYQSIQDFSDVRTTELVMDRVWLLEQEQVGYFLVPHIFIIGARGR